MGCRKVKVVGEHIPLQNCSTENIPNILKKFVVYIVYKNKLRKLSTYLQQMLKCKRRLHPITSTHMQNINNDRKFDK